MPTRTELNSVHKRLHELRRAGKNGCDKRVSELEREIAALRDEMAALKRGRSASASVAAHPKHKAVKAAKGRK
jgi:hypothetical protein